MPSPKFSETDRYAVIAALEKHFSTKLCCIGRQQKLLQAGDGRLFWIFGEYGDWHGFRYGALAKTDMPSLQDSVLVVAKRYRTTIDVYAGSLLDLVRHRWKLHRTQQGFLHFNTLPGSSTLRVKEIDGLLLDKLGASLEVAPASQNRTSRQSVESMLRGLSPEQRRALVAQFSQ